MKAAFEEGDAIFTACWTAPVRRVAIENPEMNDLARDRIAGRSAARRSPA
ncbi:hypothetical protein [Puniceibacterium confluentis]|nr:hypothetical protein [Puniceibacterium confluentis]